MRASLRSAAQADGDGWRIGGPTSGIFAPFADQARRERWDLHQLDTGHAAWVIASDALARILLDLPKET